jgi:outer membrane protein
LIGFTGLLGDFMKYSLIVAILFFAGSTLASTNDFLSWDQCLERTKVQSSELVSARAAVRELEYGVASASAGFLPQVDARANYGVAGVEVGGSWETSDDITTGRLNLSQDLFTGFGNIAKRKRAIAQLVIGQEQYRQTLADVEQRLRVAYIEVLYAQDLVDLTRKIEERRRNNVRLIQLRFDGGRENAGSLARSKAQSSQSAYEMRQAERALIFALRNLAAAMGEMNPEEGAQGTLHADSPQALTELKMLMEQTTDYRIAETQIEASKEGLRVTRSVRFPSVGLSASTAVRTSDGWGERWNGSWSAGLNASVDLFTGGRNRANVAADKENVIQSEMDLVDRANSLMASLQDRWNSYIDAVESEVTQKEIRDAEILRAEISTAKYKQGLLSYEDWDIIESNLINQAKTHLQRQRAAEQEQARWKNALGWSVWDTTGKGE